MIKHFFTLFLSGCFFLNTGTAQPRTEPVPPLIFFGIDFSQARTSSLPESAERLREAFAGINGLLETEPQKYDPARIWQWDPSSFPTIFPTEEMIRRNRAFSGKRAVPLAADSSFIRKYITSFPIGNLPETGNLHGTGCLLIATDLSKPETKGTYRIVLFSLPGKKILDTWEISGSAGGFGLRNYWAASVYDALKKSKKILKKRVSSVSSDL